jgi:hypothetical protein
MRDLFPRCARASAIDAKGLEGEPSGVDGAVASPPSVPASATPASLVVPDHADGAATKTP